MLTEATELGERLGGTEILAEAMSWRVPAFVDLCDLESARRAIPVLRETAERTAQPFMLHVAEHFASALALATGGSSSPSSSRDRSHEWGRLLTGRDSSGVYGIQMFGVQRERGRLAELAPVVRILAADAGRDGAWRPSLIALLAELGMEAEARRELARVAADGLDPLRATLWLGSLVYLADACSALGDEARGGARLSRAEAARGRQRDGRPPGRLLRRRRPLPGDARRDARRGPRPPSTSSARSSSTADGRRHLVRAHRVRVRPLPARAARGDAARPRRCSARPRRSPSASACPRCWAASGRSAPAPRRGCPTGCPRARRRSSASSRAGLSNRQLGADAVDQRAHRRQPRPQHPAQDGLRQPHRSRVLRTPPRDREKGVGSPCRCT